MFVDVEYEPADISIYIRGKGLVLKEKSLVAYNPSTGKIIAFGTEAQKIAEESSGKLHIVSPLRQGIIADYMIAEKLFEGLLRKALGKKPLIRPEIALCVPKGLTDVEQKAVEDAIYQAGAKEILIAALPAEQFVREFAERFPKFERKYKIIIGISMDNPESYIREKLAQTLSYAAQEGISAGRVKELLDRLS